MSERDRRQGLEAAHKAAVSIVYIEFFGPFGRDLNPVHRKGIDQFITKEQTSHTLRGQPIKAFHPSDKARLAEPGGQVLALQFPHGRAPFDQDIADTRCEVVLLGMERRQAISG